MASCGFAGGEREDINGIIRTTEENSTVSCTRSVHSCAASLQALHAPFVRLGVVDVDHCAAFTCATCVWRRCRNPCALRTADYSI